MKNMRYDLSLNSTIASAPIDFPNEVVSAVFALGGVEGSVKLYNPYNADTTAASIKVFGVFSQPVCPITKPEAIQPSVPNTLIAGNCFPGSCICVNATLFDNPIVGIYNKE